jgi:hypothetical protein
MHILTVGVRNHFTDVLHVFLAFARYSMGNKALGSGT